MFKYAQVILLGSILPCYAFAGSITGVKYVTVNEGIMIVSKSDNQDPNMELIDLPSDETTKNFCIKAALLAMNDSSLTFSSGATSVNGVSKTSCWLNK